MNGYNGLQLEVVRFEAQDVVTASALDTNCVCVRSDISHYHFSWEGTPCTADVHNHACDDNCQYLY